MDNRALARTLPVDDWLTSPLPLGHGAQVSLRQQKLREVRAIAARMDRPRLSMMTPTERKLLNETYREAYQKYAGKCAREGRVPWHRARYYYNWFFLQKATHACWDVKRRIREYGLIDAA
jgi:hypothetical protein